MEHWESSHIAIKSCKLVALILHLFSLIGAELSNFGYLDLLCSLTSHGFNILPQHDACTSAMLNIETLHCVHVVVTLKYLQGAFIWGRVGEKTFFSLSDFLFRLTCYRTRESRWLGTAAARVYRLISCEGRIVHRQGWITAVNLAVCGNWSFC